MMYKKFLAYSLLSLLGFYLLIIFFQPNFFNFFIIVLSIMLYLGLHAIYAIIYMILNNWGHSRKDSILKFFSYFSYALILLSGIGLLVYGYIK
jgi:hypothetical protein